MILLINKFQRGHEISDITTQSQLGVMILFDSWISYFYTPEYFTDI